MPLDVICPNCGECYFETNDEDLVAEKPQSILFRKFRERDPILFRDFKSKPKPFRDYYVREYDPDEPASAAMIHMKDEFVGTYEDIQHDHDLKGFAIEPCPNPECGQSLSDDSFKFITRTQGGDQDDLTRLTCKYCDRPPFKSVTGRVVHEDQWCPGNPNRKRA